MRTIHANSLAAYHESGEHFSERERLILGALRELGGSATDRQIKDRLNLPDMNAVRPRLSELVDSGIVEEIGTTADRVTGKRVRVLRIRPRGTEQTKLGLNVA